MPRFTGVYRAESGYWYCKATVGHDPVTSKRVQITKRGFVTASDAAAARRGLLDEAAAGSHPVSAPNGPSHSPPTRCASPVRRWPAR